MGMDRPDGEVPLEEGDAEGQIRTLGLFKADKVPKLQSIIVEKLGIEEAYGAIGIEITSFRRRLP